MQRTGRLVGRGVASLCNLLDLELVVVGGGVALGFAATFFNAAQEELSTHCRLPLHPPRPHHADPARRPRPADRRRRGGRAGDCTALIAAARQRTAVG